MDPRGESFYRLPGAEATSPSRAMGLSASISSKSRTQFLDNAILTADPRDDHRAFSQECLGRNQDEFSSKLLKD